MARMTMETRWERALGAVLVLAASWAFSLGMAPRPREARVEMTTTSVEMTA